MVHIRNVFTFRVKNVVYFADLIWYMTMCSVKVKVETALLLLSKFYFLTKLELRKLIFCIWKIRL